LLDNSHKIQLEPNTTTTTTVIKIIITPLRKPLLQKYIFMYINKKIPVFYRTPKVVQSSSPLQPVNEPDKKVYLIFY
jgi:hypothetical protein